MTFFQFKIPQQLIQLPYALPKDKILAVSQQKAFADDKIH